MNDVSRILNLQSTIHNEFPDSIRSAESITIAQHAEISLIVSKVNDQDPYPPIITCIYDLLPDFLALDAAFLAIALIEADRKYMEASK